ncbi:hypothetical protein ACUZ8Y_22370 [Aeromonas veronii]|uniref:hypothetical protein n=1 Tax=Aeromonas veronii TaxID=654 RepID=UPI00406BCCB3
MAATAGLDIGSMSEGDTASAGDPVLGSPAGPLPGLVSPAHGTPAGPVPAAGPPAADRLGAQGGHCRGWCHRLTALRRGRCLRLARQLPIGSVPRVVTAGAGDPARGTPAGPVPAAGPPAADRLGAKGGHCRGWCHRLTALRRGLCLRLARQLPTGSVPRAATAGEMVQRGFAAMH